jgi:hypothetical protein
MLVGQGKGAARPDFNFNGVYLVVIQQFAIENDHL